MNLDQPLFQISVRDYLLVERAWGWTTGFLQMGVMAVGGFAFVKLRSWWRSRRVIPASSSTSTAPCPVCGQTCDARYAQLFREGLYIDGSSELGELVSASPALAQGLPVREPS